MAQAGKESACSAGDLGWIPWLGGFPGEGNGNPLQCSCLEKPMDRGAWWATVHGVARIGHDLVTKPPPHPSSSNSKGSAYNAVDLGSISGSGRSSWRRAWQSTPVFLPRKFHGRSSLGDYSPWCLKESDMTEQLTRSLSYQQSFWVSQSEPQAVVTEEQPDKLLHNEE